MRVLDRLFERKEDARILYGREEHLVNVEGM